MEQETALHIAGGSVQNSFRVAQWILNKPKISVFFGCVGVDAYSRKLKEKATEDGVDVRYQYNESTPTGTCGVLITNHHRSLVANLAAANCFTIDHINLPENKQLVEAAEFFYISGFFLTVSPPTIQAIANHALTHNRLFLLNLSAPFISQLYKTPLLDAMPYADVLFGNETETLAFAKEMDFDTEDLHEIALKICQLPKLNNTRERIAIVTQGKDPVLIAKDGKVSEVVVEKLNDDEIVDTNGAGDAFVGGFLSQFIQNKPIVTCVRCGIWAARQIIQRSGCTFEGVANFVE